VAVNLLFTIDVDNDGVEADERTALTWKSVGLIPRLKELFDQLGLRLTWFVRADNQLRDVYGSAGYLLLEHAGLWSEMERSGDELAWHPHLYEWCEASRLYVADRDEQSCARKLMETRAELLAAGFAHSSVRIGEAFHGNALMRTLDELGLEVDSTAIPGRVRRDESRAFDWGPTPNAPYRPSASDFRVPGAGDSLRILEVPMTTMPVKASYDPDFMTRYINPAYHHANFKAGLKRLFDSQPPDGRETFLTLILHSDEVSLEGREHALYSFSLDVVRENVAYLLASLESKGLECRSIRMKDVPGRWTGAGPEASSDEQGR
jgi:hypothetical protein